MRSFNPEKELKKIQHGNKNKILYGIILLLLIISIGSTYALYQVRYSKRIIYTKVAPFSNKDIQLAVYLDNTPSSTNEFPEKNSGYRYDHIDCDNGSTAKFDTISWKVVLRVGTKDKCDVYFVKEKEEAPNTPELYQGLIPVVYTSDGTVLVADGTKDWYNYDEKRWANAVLVDKSNYGKYVIDGEYQSNTIIPMTEILQMYVWIPRYKYQLFNVDDEVISPQEIQIQFENGTSTTGTVTCSINTKGVEECTGATNGNWFTHPAFTFGNTQLTGIWMGKFEPSGNNTNLKIIPNANSLPSVTISYMFNASRSIELDNAETYNLDPTQIDTHMMKNIDWGAVMYLSHSKYGRCTDNKCVEISMAFEGTTGYSSGAWNTLNGVLSSSTGNMYGVYDLSGGRWEFVMGNVSGVDGVFVPGTSGLTSSSVLPKYYDKYEYASDYTNFHRHLGDATKETNVWYNHLQRVEGNWTMRGDFQYTGRKVGAFAFTAYPGTADGNITFRVVLTAQDGNE